MLPLLNQFPNPKGFEFLVASRKTWASLVDSLKASHKISRVSLKSVNLSLGDLQIYLLSRSPNLAEECLVEQCWYMSGLKRFPNFHFLLQLGHGMIHMANLPLDFWRLE